MPKIEQLELAGLPVESQPFAPKGIKRLVYPLWTEHKAKLIERYLYYFVQVTKTGTYIDGFAGPQQPKKPSMWAANLVLAMRPPWLKKFFLCEQSSSKFQALERLASRHPKRKVKLYHGDFNEQVHKILIAGNIRATEPTFCLLDQHTFECHWSTLQMLANFRPDPYKVELFYFLGTGWLSRAFSAQKNTSVIDRWWGNNSWLEFKKLPSDEKAKVLCARFRTELGYKHANPWPIYQQGKSGQKMFFMIHATDHDEAPALMWRAYYKAVLPKDTFEQVEMEFKGLLAGQ